MGSINTASAMPRDEKLTGSAAEDVMIVGRTALREARNGPKVFAAESHRPRSIFVGGLNRK